MMSMTGFGRAEGTVGSYFVTVETKSVNHRFFDCRFRMPIYFNPLERQLVDMLRARFERGSFEVSIRHQIPKNSCTVTTGARFAVDIQAVQSLIEAARSLRATHKLKGGVTLETLLSNNRVFIPIEDLEISEAGRKELECLFSRALDELSEMRSKEGSRLKEILGNTLHELQSFVAKIAEFAPTQPEHVRKRLLEQLSQWSLPSLLDARRLELEVALYAERADVSEEIDRLRAHAEEFLRVLELPRGVGRRLDFLTQELHREINTLGAKVAHVEISRLTVIAKSNIEKLREQVQNVE